ncbi:MAG: peptidoglycan-associated lipoprotein Pal [Burkholderiaceae bacterium]|nr:peptidoglycan-associated lipoprotein Pal [Burkholderiaceae bacterium]
MRGFQTSALLAAILMLASACSTVKLDDKAPIENRVPSGVDSSTAPASVPAPSSGAAASGDASKNARSNDPLDDPASVLSKRSIYFDLDSYAIKEEFKSVIEAHGKYLSGRPDRKVVIQGHTDERGGSEYNLALGQKRAEAVRRALALAGAKDAQMEAISFGKEKPKATGSSEEAWAQNRRADIAY